MLSNDVKYRTTIEPSNFSNEKMLLFQKNNIIAIILTWPETVFIKKTLIFSKTVD